jgi:hypothetical protein
MQTFILTWDGGDTGYAPGRYDRGGLDSIIANDNVSPGARASVTVKSGEFFKSTTVQAVRGRSNMASGWPRSPSWRFSQEHHGRTQSLTFRADLTPTWVSRLGASLMPKTPQTEITLD